jgi:hypothetical protein
MDTSADGDTDVMEALQKRTESGKALWTGNGSWLDWGL